MPNSTHAHAQYDVQQLLAPRGPKLIERHKSIHKVQQLCIVAQYVLERRVHGQHALTVHRVLNQLVDCRHRCLAQPLLQVADHTTTRRSNSVKGSMDSNHECQCTQRPALTHTRARTHYSPTHGVRQVMATTIASNNRLQVQALRLAFRHRALRACITARSDGSAARGG